MYCVGFNDDVIVSGSADSTVRVWTWFGGAMHVMREHIGVVRCLSLSDNRLLTAGNFECTTGMTSHRSMTNFMSG